MIDTREIATAKIVMLGGNGGGGGSYSAGSGIDITNNVIVNTRKGALSGVIDEITSGGYAHTQINNALDSITAGGLVVLKAESSGTANTVRIQYGEQASQSQAYRLCDTDLEYTTINVSVGDTIILTFDTTGYRLIVLSILNNSGGSGGDSYAGLGIGKMTSFTNDVIDTDIDLHRAPIAGDRLLIYLNTYVTNPRSIKIYNNGVAVSANVGEASKTHPAGLTIFRYIDDLLGWLTVQDFAYTAGKNISIVGTTINNNAPQLGMNVGYGEVTSVTDGNIGQFNGNVDYLDIDFKVNAESYAGGYTLLLSQGTMLKYAVLKNRNGYNYTANISAGTILHCLLNVSGTGTEQDPIVVKVIDENVVANPSTTPSYNLEKLKIGNITYNTSGLKMYDAYSISSGVISIHSANTSQYNGMIIAVNTSTYSGTTTNAWTLALNSGGTYLPIAMTKADGTDFTDALSENELLFVYVDTTSNQEKAIVVSLAGASGGGEGVATSVVGTVENGTAASKTYAVGEHFIRNDKFCTAIAAIASGATLTLNTNYVEGTIAEAVANKYNYSTTEHVVGKWIDGSTLYEKTFDCGTLPSSAGAKYVSTGFDSHIKVVDVKAIIISSGWAVQLPSINPGGATSDDIAVLYRKYDSMTGHSYQICITVGTNRSDYTESYVTLQYVKV